MSHTLSVAFVTAEAAPFSQTGGLGDVIPALAEAFTAEGVSVTVFLPYYKKNRDSGAVRMDFSCRVDPVITSEITRFYSIERNSVRYIFVHSPGIHTEGEYGDENGEYTDNCHRFSLFSRSVVCYLESESDSYDIVHCHDWQTGIVPALLKKAAIPVRSVFTIHNLAYQGKFDSNLIAYTGLTKNDFSFEEATDVNFMRIGLKYADKITTVSPSYAREILEYGNGCGMENLLHSRGENFYGILNGIDTNEWNPAKDEYLPFSYTTEDFSGKSEIKRYFLDQVGLKHPERPLFVMISRLAVQKGIEALYGLNGAVERILKGYDLNMAVIGTGESWVEDEIHRLDRKYDNFVGIVTFSASLSHLAEAAGDFFLMPSLYEPCGLNQLYSLRYGTIPLVTETGGLADTVCVLPDLSKQTGIRIPGGSSDDIVAAVESALGLYAGGPTAVDAVRRNGMNQDYSWKVSALKYLTFYNL